MGPGRIEGPPPGERVATADPTRPRSENPPDGVEPAPPYSGSSGSPQIRGSANSIELAAGSRT